MWLIFVIKIFGKSSTSWGGNHHLGYVLCFDSVFGYKAENVLKILKQLPATCHIHANASVYIMLWL